MSIRNRRLPNVRIYVAVEIGYYDEIDTPKRAFLTEKAAYDWIASQPYDIYYIQEVEYEDA